MTSETRAAVDAVRAAVANAESLKGALNSGHDQLALVHPNHLRTLLAALDPAEQPCGMVPTQRGLDAVNAYRAHRTEQHPKATGQ